MLRVNQLCGFGAGGAGNAQYVASSTLQGYDDQPSLPDISFSHTINASTRSIVVSVYVLSSSPGTATCTYNGVSCTQIGTSTANSYTSWQFYLNNPASGAVTLLVAFTGTNHGAVARAGIVELSDTITPANYTSDNVKTYSVTVTPTPTSGVFVWMGMTGTSAPAIAGTGYVSVRTASGSWDAGCCVGVVSEYMEMGYTVNSGGASATTTSATNQNGFLAGCAAG